MPEPTSVDVSYSRKVQLEQFEPVEYQTTVSVALGDGDDLEDVYEEYVRLVEDMTERELAQRITKQKLSEGGDDDE